MNYKKVMYEIYSVNEKSKRNGYSSESNYQYILNKGIEPYIKYRIDKTHEFMALPRKDSVEISIFYRDTEINTENYMKRNKKELLNNVQFRRIEKGDK